MKSRTSKNLRHRIIAFSLAALILGSAGFLIVSTEVDAQDSTQIKVSRTAAPIPVIKNVKKVKPLKKSAPAKNKSVVRRMLLAQVEEKVEEQVSELQSCLYEAPKKPEYKGEVIARETKIWAEEGGEFETILYFKNTGNVAWFGDSGMCPGQNYLRLGTARPQDRNSLFYNPGDNRWLSASRITMQERRVDPGEIATFSFSGYAPKVSDVFREYFHLVVDGVVWMDAKDETAQIDIYVGEYKSEIDKNLFYLGHSAQASTLDLSGAAKIEVDISEQKLWFKFGDTIVREYTVSTGTFSTPTPLGTFKILNKSELRIGSAAPHYRMPMWQGFTTRGHGLHALPYLANDRGVFWNEALNHIGQRVSHGCIRLLPEDSEELYKLTEVGMPIVIRN